MAGEKILVIEDDRDILELLTHQLSGEGYAIDIAESGEDGLRIARSEVPDLILLDLMLPGIDGYDTCRILKNDSRTELIPIIMLTAKSEEQDIVTGFEAGADDYITKPFSISVLSARIETVLGRLPESSAAGSDDTINRHGISVSPNRYSVAVHGKGVMLTPTEFQMLNLFMRRPGWVFSRDQIIDATRNNGTMASDRAIDVHVVNIRKKLGEAGRFIETVRGVGYRFRE